MPIMYLYAVSQAGNVALKTAGQKVAYKSSYQPLREQANTYGSS